MNNPLYINSEGFEGSRNYQTWPAETRDWRKYIENHLDEKVEDIITKTNKNRDDNRTLVVNAINTNGSNIVNAVNQVKTAVNEVKTVANDIKDLTNSIKSTTDKLKFEGDNLKVTRYYIN